jgi:hypothetical protein
VVVYKKQEAGKREKLDGDIKLKEINSYTCRPKYIMTSKENTERCWEKEFEAGTCRAAATT